MSTAPLPPDPPADADAHRAGDVVDHVLAALLRTWIRWLTPGLESTGVDDERWAAERLAAIPQLRAELTAAVQTTAARRLPGDVRDRIRAIAAQTAGAAVVGPEVASLAEDLAYRLGRVWPTAVQGLTAAGQQVVSEALLDVRAGRATRVEATARAVDRLAQRGVVTVLDRAGRSWSATSFVEMSVRTAVTQAAMLGRLTDARARGTDLVIVSDAPRECPQCRPWEGSVLSISGTDPNHTALDTARGSGLMHPNCRHRIYPYADGITRPIVGRPDPVAYQASQRQRQLERSIRREKQRRDLVKAVAPSSPEAVAAVRRVRALQAEMRDHLAQHPTLRRRYDREQPAGGPPTSAAGGGGTAGPPGGPPRPPAAGGGDEPPWPPEFESIPRPAGALVRPNLNLLTEDEANAIRYYTTDGYALANRALRGTRPPTNASDSLIRDLDSALAKYPLTSPIRVTRVVGADAFGLDRAERLADRVGQVVIEDGYLSTSVSAVPPVSIRPVQQVILDIVVPPGVRGVYIRRLSGLPEEREFLLERGLRYSIIRVFWDPEVSSWRAWAVVEPRRGGA